MCRYTLVRFLGLGLYQIHFPKNCIKLIYLFFFFIMHFFAAAFNTLERHIVQKMRYLSTFTRHLSILLTWNLLTATAPSDNDLIASGVTFSAKVMELKTATTVKAWGRMCRDRDRYSLLFIYLYTERFLYPQNHQYFNTCLKNTTAIHRIYILVFFS